MVPRVPLLFIYQRITTLYCVKTFHRSSKSKEEWNFHCTLKSTEERNFSSYVLINRGIELCRYQMQVLKTAVNDTVEQFVYNVWTDSLIKLFYFFRVNEWKFYFQFLSKINILASNNEIWLEKVYVYLIMQKPCI